MGVTCEIFVNKPEDGVHKAGQPVCGVINYAINKPFDCKDIVLSLVGRGSIEWTESKNRSYSGKEKYFAEHKKLLLKNVEDEIISISVGSYQHKFKFFLPIDIPSTHKGSSPIVKSKINYYLQLKFIRSGMFAFDKIFTKDLLVHGNVKQLEPNTQLIFGLEKVFLPLFSSEKLRLNLKCEVCKTLFTPGESIETNIVIKNQSDVKVTAVKTKIMCITTYTASTGKNKIEDYTVKETSVKSEGVGENSEAKFSTTINIPPDLYSIQNSNIIEKKFALRVIAKLPMPHRDSFVDLPIIIGERISVNEYECEEMNLDNEPPSYWKAMNECDGEPEKLNINL